MSICELHNVGKSYGTGPARVDALKGVTLSIEQGEFTVFQGPSGSGKTTLLNQVGCLDAPTTGEVSLGGRTTSKLSSRQLSRLRAETIGFVFQSFNLIPVLSARENVELALELAGRPEERRERAARILERVGLGGMEDRRPNELSGGQQQRVAIARALVKEPILVIADEPTANLDSHTGEEIIELMAELNKKLGTTFLFSSHDPLVIKHARRVVTLHDGELTNDRRLLGAAGTAQVHAP